MEIERRQALAMLPGLAVAVMALKAENPLVGGTVLRRAAIQSPNFVTGVSGWTIKQDGSAEFNNVVIRNGQIVSGTALFYSGVPALGNLVASISAAAGTDSAGNAYLAGVASYSNTGTNASASNGGIVTFYTAPGPGGPWTAAATLAGGTSVLSGVTNGSPLAVVPALSVTGAQAAGAILLLTNSTAAPTFPNARVRSKAAADAALGLDVTGDTVPRLLADSNGKLSWSTGALAADTDLYRFAAGILKTDNELDVGGLLKALAALSVVGGITADTEVLSAGVAGGNVLDVTNTTAGGAAPVSRITSAAVGDLFLGARVSGDTSSRIVLDTVPATGLARLRLGPGNAAPDVTVERLAANSLGVLGADLAVDTVGRGLQIKTGTNAKMGTTVLSAGTKLVANTSVTANSLIFLSRSTAGGTLGELSYTISAGVSFTITSSSNLDTSTINYLIMEPAP